LACGLKLRSAISLGICRVNTELRLLIDAKHTVKSGVEEPLRTNILDEIRGIGGRGNLE
jgi:hypothetical protein